MDSFKTVLIKDARIADITSQEVYGVVSGGAQSTQQQIAATSASTSSLVFQVQVPSENIVIDRNVQIQASLSVNINISNAPAYRAQPIPQDEVVFDYGTTDAFQVFPLNSLFTTSSCTINNTNVSANTQDIFPQLTRMNSARELYRYNSTSPSLPDSQWGLFSDATQATNNPLGGFANNSLDLDFDPRGAFPTIITVQHLNNGVVIDDSLISQGLATESWIINVQTIVTEPLFGLSPFTWCDPEFSSQGILGVNNMAFVFNIDAACKRLWSSANDYINTISLVTPGCFQVCQLLFTYLSLQPTDVVSTKNVVPYMDYPRFISNTSVAMQGFDPAQPNNLTVTKLTSNSIQLNQVPDKMIIVARIPMSQQTYQNTSSFLAIQQIVCNFNNASGLLSSATQVDLWKMSMRNGSSQNFNEFYGFASVATAEGAGVYVPTTGAMLVLNPTIDFGLPNYLSAGSQGNFNFQFNLSVYNQFPNQFTPELVLICVNSGIMVTSQGVSSLYTGMLTKELVLKTNEEKAEDPISTVEYQRLVGGKVSNMPLTALHKLYKKRHGGQSSGGVMSGGVSSGGYASSGGMMHSASSIGRKRAHKM
jgi:hypothetical protein